LQGIGEPAVMDGDWRAVARRSRALLPGHTGRVGMHAPFWNLSVGAIDPQIRAVVQARRHQAWISLRRWAART